MTRDALRAAGRFAVLLAVGLALAASTVPPDCSEPPPLPAPHTYDLISDCGPAGTVWIGLVPDRNWCEEGYELTRVRAEGAAEVGLPTAGKLIDAPPGVEPKGSRGIAAGDFYLAGPVYLDGAVPPATVDRVCRFTQGDEGVLEMICLGSDPGANCTGTLTPVSVAL
jgi:hypothetical protein